ncbi:hypothetical protein BDL97_11G064100 [Sphagnum fallax]|nr:hypothetical protein BDL97_11G064100 [Sphagnum fallax]
MVFSTRALVFSIFLSSLTVACYCKGLAAKVQKSSTATPALVPASFVFGDSLVDAGNNNYIRSLARANYPANGIDFPGHVPTGRFTNNRTVADIVGQLLGLPSFVPVFMNPATKGKVILQGVNYASGGAGILDFTGYAFIHRIPMWEQIKNFQNTSQQIMQILGPSAGATLIKNSVFSITMGANDYLNNYLVVASPTPRLYNPQNLQNLLISTFKQQLLDFADADRVRCSQICNLQCGSSRMYTIPYDHQQDHRRHMCTIGQYLSQWLQHSIEELDRSTQSPIPTSKIHSCKCFRCAVESAQQSSHKWFFYSGSSMLWSSNWTISWAYTMLSRSGILC